MSTYDDEEYESFDLASGAEEEDLVVVPEDLDEDDDDDSDDFGDDDDDDEDDDDIDDDEDDDDIDDDEDDDDIDDDEDEDEDDDYDDDIEDAVAEDIDLVVALYREDGQSVGTALNKDLANDLDELITQLRRQPADAGAIGVVSLLDELFVLVRVRGRHVQALLSDSTAALDFPIARDVADFLGEDVSDDDDAEPLGDLDILSDLGIDDFEMEAYCDNYDDVSTDLLTEIAEKIKAGPAFRKAMDTFD